MSVPLPFEDTSYTNIDHVFEKAVEAALGMQIVFQKYNWEERIWGDSNFQKYVIVFSNFLKDETLPWAIREKCLSYVVTYSGVVLEKNFKRVSDNISKNQRIELDAEAYNTVSPVSLEKMLNKRRLTLINCMEEIGLPHIKTKNIP